MKNCSASALDSQVETVGDKLERSEMGRLFTPQRKKVSDFASDSSTIAVSSLHLRDESSLRFFGGFQTSDRCSIS